MMKRRDYCENCGYNPKVLSEANFLNRRVKIEGVIDLASPYFVIFIVIVSLMYFLYQKIY